MASLVKTKVSLIVGAVLLSVLISGMDSNFFRAPLMKRWSEEDPLKWDDFLGVQPPFTSFGAAINSQVYLEYDSLANAYTAYAAQNNMFSWTKTLNDDALTHEQYHFNITELHARKLNEYLQEYQDLSHKKALIKLKQINQELADFQAKYDKETGHSVLRSMQAVWEYRIDSLLLADTPDKGWAIDYLSGVGARFMKPYTIISSVNEDSLAVRGMKMDGYDMEFHIYTVLNTGLDQGNFEDYCRSKYKGHSFYTVKPETIKGLTIEALDGMIVDRDSDEISWKRFYNFNDELVIAEVRAPNHPTALDTYKKIRNSFLTTINFSDTRDYWYGKGANLEGNNNSSPSDNTINNLREKGKFSICYSGSNNHIFTKRPFLDANDNLYIAYDILQHPKEEVYANVVLIEGERLIDFSVEPGEQFIHLPDSLLPKKSFKLKLGYILLKDSTKDCFWYYNQTFRINLNERN